MKKNEISHEMSFSQNMSVNPESNLADQIFTEEKVGRVLGLDAEHSDQISQSCDGVSQRHPRILGLPSNLADCEVSKAPSKQMQHASLRKSVLVPNNESYSHGLLLPHVKKSKASVDGHLHF